MKRTLKISPQAELELEEARRWYEKRQPGLGREFLRAFDDRIQLLRVLPKNAALVALSTRRAQLRPFQYFVRWRLRSVAGPVQLWQTTVARRFSE